MRGVDSKLKMEKTEPGRGHRIRILGRNSDARTAPGSTLITSSRGKYFAGALAAMIELFSIRIQNRIGVLRTCAKRRFINVSDNRNVQMITRFNSPFLAKSKKPINKKKKAKTNDHSFCALALTN